MELEQLMIEHKIIITGPMGAGKTTAIAVVSEIEPMSTDVMNTDKSVDKEKTTVAFDYGEVSLSETERLRIYGTPGQDRFSFMWKVLSKGALGVVILVDDSKPDPFKELSIYLENFSQLIEETACVVCISKTDKSNMTRVNEFASYLAAQGVVCPVVPADVREKQEVLFVLELLLTQLYA